MKTQKFVIACLFIVVALGASAQPHKTTFDLLTQNDWTSAMNMGENDSISVKQCYTLTEFITVAKYQDKKIEGNASYYLSDELEWKFDENKVGKVSSGKYIVMNHDKFGVYISEILKISEKELTIELLAKPGELPIVEPHPVTLYAIPKGI